MSLVKIAGSRQAFRWALVVSIASVVVPILTTSYLPFTDAPEHAAVMATLRHWGDPMFSRPYVLAVGRSQYLVYHVAGAALTWLTRDAELANRLLLAIAGVAFPLSFRALLRATSRDERLSIFACLPFFSRSLAVGFLPFVASIPIAFWGLALVFRSVRQRTSDERSRRRELRLAALAIVLFYAHVSSWTIFIVVASVVALFARRLQLVGVLAPSTLAAGLWLYLGRMTLGGGSLADAGEITRMGAVRSMLSMPRWLFDLWRGHGDEVAATFWWSALLLVVLQSARQLGRYSGRAIALLYIPFACALVVYLVTPWRVGAALMLNVRLAPVLVLLALLPTRLRARRSPIALAAIGLALVANLVGGITAFVESRAARRELGDLDAVLSAMPGGARLMTLNFDTRSGATHVFPWAHVGSYHRVRHGGVAGFSFTELRHWPIQYAASERPPQKENATWDFDPCTFRNAIDGPYYDFVLVRGGVDPFISEPAGPIFRRAVTAGPMTLFRKEPGAWPDRAKPDQGPCPERPAAGATPGASAPNPPSAP